jgi:hypothetical protein
MEGAVSSGRCPFAGDALSLAGLALGELGAKILIKQKMHFLL